MIWPTIPNLRKDGEGYVYWKDVHVEHFSFRDDVAETAAYEDLAKKCLHLEALGVPVNCRTACWHFSWFEHLTPDNKYLPILRTTPSIWVRPTKILPAPNLPDGIHRTEDEGDELLIGNTIWNRQTMQATPTVILPRKGEIMYHALVGRGWRTPNADGRGEGNGLVYASTEGMLDLLERFKVPPTLLV